MTPVNDALGALDPIWRYTNHWKGDQPTLFDVLAIELVRPASSYELESLHLEVTDDGLTRPVSGRKANAQASIAVDAPAFMKAFVETLAR